MDTKLFLRELEEKLTPETFTRSLSDNSIQQPQESDINYGKEGIALTGEIGSGVALDMATNWMLASPDPFTKAGYVGINLFGGATANYIAQQYRTDEDLAWYDRNWGEVISSGLLGVIPGMGGRAGKFTRFVGKPNTYQRAITSGIGTGVADQFIRKGIDEGRLPTGGEIATGAIIGGVTSPLFKKSFDEVAKIFTKYQGKSVTEINKLIEPDEAEHLSKHLSILQRGILEASEAGDMPKVRKLIFDYRKAKEGAHPEYKSYDDFKENTENFLYKLNNKMDDRGDLVAQFNDAKKRGMVKEMTTLFNQMDDIEKNRLDMQLRGLQHKLSPRSTRSYVEPNFQEVAIIKQHIVDYKIAGKNREFDWFRFHGTLNPTQQRLSSVIVSTNPQAAIGSSWKDYTKQLRDNFIALYDTNLVRKKGYIIDVDHGITLVQSMPIYHGLVPGSDMYNTVQKRILAKGYKPGNAADNLTALDRSVHNLKSAYFNKLHGKTGLNFFTMDVLRKFKPGPNWTQAQADAYRLKMLDLYLEQVDEGQKIIEKAQKAYHYLHTNDTLIPEQIVDALTDIITDHDGGIVKKYTSRQLRELLKDIDDAYPAALKFDYEDRREILRQEILRVEKLGKSANPRLKILERKLIKLDRAIRNLPI